MFKRNRFSSWLMFLLIAAMPAITASSEKPPMEPAPVGPQDPTSFVPVSAGPVAFEGAVGAVVKMAEVPATPQLAKAAAAFSVHVQGEYLQHDVPRGQRSAISSSDPGQPMVEIDVEPRTVDSAAKVSAPGAGVVGFDGAPASGWIPPDTVLAVGPEYIVEAVNSGFHIFTKTGLETRAYTDFSTFVNLPAPWNGILVDPRVVFDPWSEQFVMMIMGVDETNLKSYFWILVSKNSNPNGEWWMWRIDSSTGIPGFEQWLDFPSLGTDPWGVYVVGNSFGFAEGSGFKQSRLWSLNRDLMNGGASDFIVWNGLLWPHFEFAFSLQVAQAQTGNYAQATYLINNHAGSGTQVLLWTLTGDRFVGQGLGDPTLARAAIDARTYFGIFNNVDQPSSDWDIDGGDCRIQNAVYSQGKVYATFTIDPDGDQSNSEAYVAAFNTGDATKAWDHTIWNPDYYLFYPAIAIEGSAANPSWMVAMSMTVPSDPLGFAGTVGVTHDRETDTGAFWWDWNGLGPYSVWDGDFEGDGRNRWGDYSMAAYDWSCLSAWGAAEYATDNNSWATRIFARTMKYEPPCPYIHVVSPNGGGAVLPESSQLVQWNTMNIPIGDEIWVLFEAGPVVFEDGPYPSGQIGTYWYPPNVDAPKARIGVGAWDPVGHKWRALDYSDETFEVTGMADLTVHSMGFPQPTYPGREIRLSRSVRNWGPVDVRNYYDVVRLSPDTTCTSDDLLLRRRRNRLVEAGGLDGFTHEITLPKDVPIGAQYLCLMLDPDDHVPEIDETNNIMYREFEILDPTLFADNFESGNMSLWSSAVP